MKKKIVFLVFTLLLVFIVSCSSTSNFHVLEIGGYDYFLAANHKCEIQLEEHSYKKPITPSKMSVNVNGKSVELEYEKTVNGYLYNSELDYFSSKTLNDNVRVGVNNSTGRIDYYAWIDKEYSNNRSDAPRLNESECLDVAIKHLDGFVETQEYSLIDVVYMAIPEFEGVYKFTFVRMIDEFKTADNATIYVSIFGDITMYIFDCLGEMKDAIAPSKNDLKIIESNVDVKIKDIYKSVSIEYSHSYEIYEQMLIRLSDDSYAMKYTVDVQLVPINSAAKAHIERVDLLVFVDN